MPREYELTREDLRVFLDEAEELLQTMEQEILALEQSPQDLDPVQSVFRAAHTLKGSSATLGHRQMAEVTHGLESLLDKLRKQRLRPTRAIIDTLFACLDVLRTLKEEIASGVPAGIETAEVLARLTEVEDEAAAAQMAEPAAVHAGAAAEPAGPASLVGQAEQDRIAAARARGQSGWSLTVTPVLGAPMPAVRFFQVLLTLREIGEVLVSRPEQEEIEQDQVGSELQVIFVSDRAETALREVLNEVPEIRIEELAPIGAEAPAPMEPAAGSETAGEAETDLRAAGPEPAAGRKPTRTVRVDVDVLDNLMNQVGELVIDRTRLTQMLSQVEAALRNAELARELQVVASHIGRVTNELQQEIMRARMLPVENLFRKFPRMVRDLAQKAQKEISLLVSGEETELDRSVIEEIGDPLMHLIRNAIDHGIESPDERRRTGKSPQGRVWLEARHEENQIVITVRDDGRGIDPVRLRESAVRKGLLTDEQARHIADDEVLRLIFTPGFSTAEQVSDLSGRGVGLDVVYRNIERLNGAVEIRSEVGKGTEFRVKLPLTLAIIRALLVRHRDVVYAVPLGSVTETMIWPIHQVQTIQHREVIVNRDQLIPLLRLERAFGQPAGPSKGPADELVVVVVHVLGRQAGLVVDGLVGEGDVVIKSLGRYVGEVPGISGATILGDGSVALILDVANLMGPGIATLALTTAS